MKNGLKYDRLKQIWPLFPAAIFLILFLVTVLSYLLYISFSYSGAFPSIKPLQLILQNEQFANALKNTTLFVLIGTPLELFLGVSLAVLVYRSTRLKTLVRSLFIIPLAIPGLVVATLLSIMFSSQGGFINHLLRGQYPLFPEVISADINWRGEPAFVFGLSLIGKVWRDMPLTMLIILSALNNIDPQIFNAAKLLGAGLRVRFFKIILPLLFPSITVVLLLRSIEMWKEFIFPYILAGDNHLLGTLIKSLYDGFIGKEKSEAAIVSLILVICIIATLLIITTIMKLLSRHLIDKGEE